MERLTWVLITSSVYELTWMRRWRVILLSLSVSVCVCVLQANLYEYSILMLLEHCFERLTSEDVQFLSNL